jgi:co-chaperonin GroES (HSP10)
MTKAAYEPNRINKLTPIHDGVIVVDMNFEHRVTTAGIIIPGDDGKNSGIRPRWGQVYAVGPEQKDVKVGQYICVAHGRWTRGISVTDESGQVHTLRRVDNNDILLVSDEPVTDGTMSDKVI